MWAFPKHAFNDGDIVDVDKLNATVAEYAHQAASLDETNWAAGTLTGLKEDDKLRDDISAILHIKRNGGADGVDPFSYGSEQLDILSTVSWRAVDGTSKSFYSRGGMVLIIVSFQLEMDATVGQQGLQFAIGFDDEPRLESLLGSAEMSNNTSRLPAFRYPTTVDSDEATPPGDPEDASSNYRGTGPAIMTTMCGINLQLAVYAEPGEHTFDLRARCVAVNVGSYDQLITQYTGIAIELNCDPGGR